VAFKRHLWPMPWLNQSCPAILISNLPTSNHWWLAWGSRFGDGKAARQKSIQGTQIPDILSRYFPDQADIPQHMTLWDASNYKTASRARQLPCDSLYCPTPMA
jgi:hypothetical protein